MVIFISLSLPDAEHRCVESAKIRNKYPDRVPVSGHWTAPFMAHRLEYCGDVHMTYLPFSSHVWTWSAEFFPPDSLWASTC